MKGSIKDSQNGLERLTHLRLYSKYSTSQNFYYSKEVDDILEETISTVYIRYEDDNYYDDRQEYFKREYKDQEYRHKISVLTQYYKFHRNLPTWNEKQIDDIMIKYYNRIKDVDYKKIKQLLKKQQGISLSTHNSFSSFEEEEFTKKSRYSTMLKQLESSNDSVDLREICEEINKAYKKIKMENNFKGCYYSGEKKFEQYLKKQKKRKQNNIKKQQDEKKSTNPIYKKSKSKQNMTSKPSNQIYKLKQIILDENKQQKNKKQNQQKYLLETNKIILNQIMVKDDKNKKNKNIYPISSKFQHLYKSNSKEHFICDLVREKLKNIKFCNNHTPNQNIRMMNQLSKPLQKLDKKQKVSSQLTKKPSTKQLISKLKYRSNSHHNLPTAPTLLSKDFSKKQLISISSKINRSNSKNTLPFNLAKKSIIQHDIFKGSHKEEDRNNGVQKIFKKNSIDKFSINSNQKKYSTMKICMDSGKGFAKKRNSAVENILEKKLEIYRKKNYGQGN